MDCSPGTFAQRLRSRALRLQDLVFATQWTVRAPAVQDSPAEIPAGPTHARYHPKAPKSAYPPLDQATLLDLLIHSRSPNLSASQE